MDENKENINSEEEIETASNASEETINAQAADKGLKGEELDEALRKLCEEDDEKDCEPALEQTEIKEPYESEETTKKKKSLIQYPVIISAAIVVCLLLAFLVVKCFFNTSIVGTWTVDSDTSTADEADSDGTGLAYYTFDSDGTLTITQGTMRIVSDYEIYEEDGTDYMYSSAFYTEYAYAVTGNVFSGRKLILTDSSSSVALAGTTVKTPTLKADDDFEADEKLTGKWNIPDYYVTYEFRSDGTFSFNQSDVYYYDGVYNYDDENLTLSYYTSELQEVSIEYYFDSDNTLIINGLGYYRMNDDGTLVSTEDES